MKKTILFIKQAFFFLKKVSSMSLRPSIEEYDSGKCETLMGSKARG